MAKKTIVAVGGKCSFRGQDVGFQFIKYDAVCELAGSFSVTPGEKSASMGDLTGKFVIGQNFKAHGCKLCKNRFVYQCGACKALVCYDGAEHRDVACPACGAVMTVPATKDDRIVMSGKAESDAWIMLAMDVSGSMAGGRISETKQAAVDSFLRKFTSGRFALVTFGWSVETVLPFTTDLRKVENAIGALTADGGTPSPLPHILSRHADFLRAAGKRYLVIFTDGAWDYGNHIADAQAIKQAGVEIITIGCAGADQRFLSQIATPGAHIVASDGHLAEKWAEALSIIKQG